MSGFTEKGTVGTLELAGYDCSQSCMVTLSSLRSKFLMSRFFKVCRGMVKNGTSMQSVRSTLLWLFWSDLAPVDVSFHCIFVLLLLLVLISSVRWQLSLQRISGNVILFHADNIASSFNERTLEHLTKFFFK